jgi:hypothetical protein
MIATHWHAIVIYGLINAALALVLHWSTLQHTLDRPSAGELIVGGSVFLIAGTPLLILVIVFSIGRWMLRLLVQRMNQMHFQIPFTRWRL